MNMSVKRRVLSVMLTLVILCGAVLPVMAESEGLNEVSLGLSVLSAKTDVSFSAMVGNDIVFSADGFARGLNLSTVRYITEGSE